MNGLDGMTGWKNIKQRLSFKGLGCCGATWNPRTLTGAEGEEEEEEEEPIIIQDQVSDQLTVVTTSVGHIPVHHSTNVTNSGMNLAMALAAERNLRGGNVGPRQDVGQVKTLKRLIEETDGVDWRKISKKSNKDKDKASGDGGNQNDWVCCVCMERNKGAAFIPCGHTFCRVCSRELWVNRGSCPICNRSILEILDIF